MTMSRMGMGALALGRIGASLAGVGAALTATAVAAQVKYGQPTDGAFGLQPSASPLKEEATFFHNWILMPIIVVICVLVLGLIAWIAIRYNKKSNPTPAKWSHNTIVEVIWTVVPVLVLVFISLFSFRLLFAYHNAPEPDLTIKVTGNQWNWAYEYPDQGIAEYYSNMLPEEDARARGVPFRLAADEPMVVPVGANVQLLVTASDVIHAVALPAFGLKTDAVPGRVNSTWFRTDRPGVYYGQCSELCGVDHAFMPLEIRVVSQGEFEAWVVSKGGSMTPPQPEAEAAAVAATPAAANAAASEAAGTEPNPTAQTATTPTEQPAQPAAAPVANAPAPAAGAPAAQ